MAYNCTTNKKKWLTKTILPQKHETIGWQYYINWSYSVGLTRQLKYKIGHVNEGNGLMDHNVFRLDV